MAVEAYLGAQYKGRYALRIAPLRMMLSVSSDDEKMFISARAENTFLVRLLMPTSHPPLS